MLLKIIKKRTTLAILPFLNDGGNSYDVPKGQEDVIFSTDENLTGLQRLKSVWQYNDNDELHPLLVTIMQTSFASFFLGGAYGGVKGTKVAMANFIDNNHTTQFANHLDAKRKLLDNLILSFAKNFTIWGLKVCFFASSFVIGQTLLSVYQNKSTMLNYTFGGMYAGALYKIPLGPKGMISGAVFGSLFGTLFGGSKYLLYKLANVTEEDITKMKYQLYLHRKEAVDNAIKQIELKRSMKELERMNVNKKVNE